MESTTPDVDFNTFVVQPSIDAIQELKVQTGVYPARYGYNQTQINVVTKSGTNNYHGAGFYFLRNNYADALGYNYNYPSRLPIVLYYGGLWIVIVISECIRVVVAQEVEPGPVVIVGAALGDHVDSGSGCNRIGRDRRPVAAFSSWMASMEGWTTKVLKVDVGVVDSIERVVVEHNARAADRDASLARAPPSRAPAWPWVGDTTFVFAEAATRLR